MSTVIEAEASFGRTLDRGLDIFAKAAERAEKSGGKVISGEDAFALYDTYGFPVDLTQLMARERGLTVDTATFDTLMEEQRARARAAQKTNSMAAGLGGAALPATDDSAKYEGDVCRARVVGWIDAEEFKAEGNLNETPARRALCWTGFFMPGEAGGRLRRYRGARRTVCG